MAVLSSPHHIAIIMDGNGRWALQKGLPRVSGHQEGVKAAMNMVDCAIKRNIKKLTRLSVSLLVCRLPFSSGRKSYALE